jgi:hypothetical protein
MSKLSGRGRAASVVGALVAVFALAAFVGPSAALAHTGDALHQHTWSTQLRNTTQVIRCLKSDPGWQDGTISLQLPDLVTSPGNPGKVYFTAGLDYWGWDGYRYRWLEVNGSAKPWLYNYATANGLRYPWRVQGTNAWGEPLVFRPLTPGVYYRLHFYFFWEADNTFFNADTQSDFCLM